MTGRTVTVTGTGAVPVVPDSAVLRVAATYRASGVVEALAGADEAVRTLLEVARRHTDRVGTGQLSLWPRQDGPGRATGYEARHGLVVRLPDPVQAGELVTELAGAVGDRLAVEGLSLEVTDRSAAMREARELAYADARDRAAQLAALAGATLGEALTVAEGGDPGTGPVRLAAAGARGAVVEPGEQDVVAGLTVTFALA